MSQNRPSTKPWQLKKWRVARAEHIKDKCEICGSTKVITLHHRHRALQFWEIRVGIKDFLRTGYWWFPNIIPPPTPEVLQACKSTLNLPDKELIKKIATVITKEQYKKYLTCEDTITLCKSCHFKVEKGLVLCRICHKNWHSPHYDCCFECLPEADGESKSPIKSNPQFNPSASLSSKGNLFYSK